MDETIIVIPATPLRFLSVMEENPQAVVKLVAEFLTP
jgi:hypothetical protein